LVQGRQQARPLEEQQARPQVLVQQLEQPQVQQLVLRQLLVLRREPEPERLQRPVR
jgi:hypothetical protein